jgi:membrane-associated phospholipid phosphatase
MRISTSQDVSKRNAVRTSTGLCLLFLLVYGGTNYLTSFRHDVGTWVYPWEHSIPFVPLMIIPYMSIDLFFIASPFVCSDRKELSILSRRIVMGILVAGFFFLVMPLRFTFERPAAPGALGVVFERFRAMDRPFNQFPSLHMTLRTILAHTYSRHTRGWKRVASNAWFSLIGFSTVLTYQHHIADVIGGLLLAGLCFYVIGEARWRQPVTRNSRVGAIYCVGTAALVAIAMTSWPWGAVLLWPALSLSIVACGYFGIGPGTFRKEGGRLPIATWLLLAPVILGQRLSMLRYIRRSKPWDAITANVWIGRTLNAREGKRALDDGVTAILDLTCELPETPVFARHPNYHNLPVLDLTAPTAAQFAEAIAFIDRHVRKGGVVYVHCKAGYSRSAAIVAAYLLKTNQVADATAALAHLRRCRSGIIIRPEALAAISDSPKEMELAAV